MSEAQQMSPEEWEPRRATALSEDIADQSDSESDFDDDFYPDHILPQPRRARQKMPGHLVGYGDFEAYARPPLVMNAKNADGASAALASTTAGSRTLRAGSSGVSSRDSAGSCEEMSVCSLSLTPPQEETTVSRLPQSVLPRPLEEADYEQRALLRSASSKLQAEHRGSRNMPLAQTEATLRCFRRWTQERHLLGAPAMARHKVVLDSARQLAARAAQPVGAGELIFSEAAALQASAGAHTGGGAMMSRSLRAQLEEAAANGRGGVPRNALYALPDAWAQDWRPSVYEAPGGRSSLGTGPPVDGGRADRDAALLDPKVQLFPNEEEDAEGVDSDTACFREAPSEDADAGGWGDEATASTDAEWLLSLRVGSRAWRASVGEGGDSQSQKHVRKSLMGIFLSNALAVAPGSPSVPAELALFPLIALLRGGTDAEPPNCRVELVRLPGGGLWASLAATQPLAGGERLVVEEATLPALARAARVETDETCEEGSDSSWDASSLSSVS